MGKATVELRGLAGLGNSSATQPEGAARHGHLAIQHELSQFREFSAISTASTVPEPFLVLDDSVYGLFPSLDVLAGIVGGSIVSSAGY